jgi:hypothetical protein
MAGAVGVVIVECDTRCPLRLPHIRNGPLYPGASEPSLEVKIPVCLVVAASESLPVGAVVTMQYAPLGYRHAPKGCRIGCAF